MITRACAVALLALAVQAAASPPPPPGPTAMRQAAQCLLRHRMAAGAKLAAARPGSPAEAAAFAKLRSAMGPCLKDARIEAAPENEALLAGAVAETIYRGRVAELRRSWKPLVPGLPDLGREQAVSRTTEGWPVAAAVAECAVEVDSGAADAFLHSDAGSPDERAAMAQVVATLPNCVPAGLRVDLSPERLRAEVARAMYRLVASLPRSPLPS